MIDLTTARATITAEVTRILDLIRSLDEWSKPTRLEGWTVRDLVEHLVWGQSLQADAWERLAAGDDGAAQAQPVTGLGQDELAAALRNSADRFDHALSGLSDEQVAQGVCVMPYGTLPAVLVLHLAVMEAGVHGSDVAAAAGSPDELSPPVVDASAFVLGAMLPMLGSGGDGSAEPGTTIALGSPGFSVVTTRDADGWQIAPDPSMATTTISGSDTEIVLFVLGRRSVDDVQVEGDTAPATKFKAWFPGP